MKNRPRTSLDKALHLLQLLGGRGWTGVRELARQAEYTPSSVHGLLQVLCDHGFVEFDAERRQYRLGIAVLSLAETMDAGDALATFARPAVQRVAAELDETVLALAWRGGQALVVAAVEARHDLRVDPGRRVPDRPHLWASGQVLLAHLPEAECAAYLARACPDAAVAAGVRATLAMVREQGWATAHDIDGSGVWAVGAPVLDAGGRCLLALGCSAPVPRSTPERQQRMRERLCAAAAALTASLRPT
jgi:DNA-binding IclR family transcriptional regulator